MPVTGPARYLSPLMLMVVCVSVFLLYSSPMGTGDPWWHLNNGRWIVENGEIPDSDHFTHTASDEPSDKKTFVLKTYWLAQILMYLVYKAAGPGGLVAARALVFTLTFLVVYLCMREGGMGRAGASSLVALSAVALMGFSESRPHILSFMMCAAVVYMLESRRRRGLQRMHILLLPLIMVLWANFHAGFVIGIGIIGIYLFSDTIRLIVVRQGRDTKEYIRTSLWLAGSMLIGGLNPSGFGSIMVALFESGRSPFISMIDEYVPTLSYARLTGDMFLLYGIPAITALTSSALLLSWRRLRLEHVLLYAAFAYEGYAYYRYSAFFALISVALAGQYIHSLRDERVFGMNIFRLIPSWTGRAAALAVAVLFFLLAAGSENIIRAGALNKGNTPLRAVSAIRSSALPPELFNPYEWGGFIGWHLYPEYRVFVDGRAIDMQAQLDYQRIKDGDLGVLDSRGVNTVIFYTLEPVRFGSGVPGVVRGLLRDPGWGLVFYDEISAVFVRTRALKRRVMMLGKGLLWDQLEERLSGWAGAAPADHRPPAELGKLYAARGEREKAMASLERSLELRPGNAEAMEVIRDYGLGQSSVKP